MTAVGRWQGAEVCGLTRVRPLGPPGERPAGADSRCGGFSGFCAGASARRRGHVLGPGCPFLAQPGPPRGGVMGASGEAGVGEAEGAGVRPRGSRSCPLLCGAGPGFDLSRLRQRQARGTLLPLPELPAQDAGSEGKGRTRLPRAGEDAGRAEEGTGTRPVTRGHDRRPSPSRAPCWGQIGSVIATPAVQTRRPRPRKGVRAELCTPRSPASRS